LNLGSQESLKFFLFLDLFKIREIGCGEGREGPAVTPQPDDFLEKFGLNVAAEPVLENLFAVDALAAGDVRSLAVEAVGR